MVLDKFLSGDMRMKPDFTNPKQVLALTLYGEIRGGPTRAKEHVASVIMNRVKHPGWWGKTVVSVCMAKWQFSCWWLTDANHATMMAAREADPIYQSCLTVAGQAIDGVLIDETHGADSYFAEGSPTPSWAGRGIHLMDDGCHSFYLIEVPDSWHADDPGAPTVSIHVIDETQRTEDLNQLELERIAAVKAFQPS